MIVVTAKPSNKRSPAPTFPTQPFPEGFDPLGFASRADKQQMYKFREAELKHGRVAMLAVPGFLLSEDFHPFFPTLPKVVCGVA